MRRIERWLKGEPCEEVKIIFSADQTYLQRQPSIWMLQWNEASKAYQFEFLFGPRVKDAPTQMPLLAR